MDDALRNRASENVEKMRADSESDWPDRLLRDLGQSPDVGELDSERLPKHARWVNTPLTAQELRALQAASFGLTVPMTADLMVLAPDTIREHRRAVIFKLRAKNMCHAIGIALRQKIIV